MHKRNDVVTYVENGVEFNALVLSSASRPDAHPGTPINKDTPQVEQLTLLFIPDRTQGVPNLFRVGNGMFAQQLYGVRPIADGRKTGWKEYSAESSSDQPDEAGCVDKVEHVPAPSILGKPNPTPGDHDPSTSPVAGMVNDQSPQAIDTRGGGGPMAPEILEGMSEDGKRIEAAQADANGFRPGLSMMPSTVDIDGKTAGHSLTGAAVDSHVPLYYEGQPSGYHAVDPGNHQAVPEAHTVTAQAQPEPDKDATPSHPATDDPKDDGGMPPQISAAEAHEREESGETKRSFDGTHDAHDEQAAVEAAQQQNGETEEGLPPEHEGLAAIEAAQQHDGTEEHKAE